jgi:hypothetical protein
VAADDFEYVLQSLLYESYDIHMVLIQCVCDEEVQMKSYKSMQELTVFVFSFILVTDIGI